MMRNEKKRLYVSIEQLSRQTEWAGWFKEVLLAAAQVSLYRIETWEPFKSLSDNTMAVRWLTKQIRLCNPLPPRKTSARSRILYSGSILLGQPGSWIYDRYLSILLSI